MKWTLTVAGLMTSLASTAYGQSCPAAPTPGTITTNANAICFTASGDHDALDLGQPVLAEYRLDFFMQGVDSTDITKQPFQQVSLGKPTPQGPNKIIQMQRNELSAVPVGQLFYGVIEAVGTNGAAARSAPSTNFFGVRSNRSPAAPTGTPIIFRQ